MMKDNMLVNIIDPLRVNLRYPQGGEILNGMVAIHWLSSDGKNLMHIIHIYYSRIQNVIAMNVK
jgi:hypothetical protein